jgi:LPS export ABC transporter protein LptC
MLCPTTRRPASGARTCAFALGLATCGLAAIAVPASAADAAAPRPRVPGVASEVYVTGMTFVVSREGEGDLVLEARHATLHPESNMAELQDAEVRSSDGPHGRSFDVRCDRGELDLTTNDFLAEGDVHGSTAEGQRYAAPWVRYQRARGLLYTDAPVVLEDRGGSYRGDGFRYHVRERRMELLGNVSVVHRP